MAAIGYPKIPTAIFSWRKTGPGMRDIPGPARRVVGKMSGAQKKFGVFWNGWWQQSGLKTWYTMLVGGLEHFLFSPIAGMMIQSD